MDKKDIRLLKKNESSLEVWTSESISRELTLHFSARPTGYQFMPSYKMGHFDGWIRFYKNNTIPIGLLDEIKEFAHVKKYSVEENFNDCLGLEKIDFVEFIKHLNVPDKFELRDYQIDAAFDCINDTKRCVKANTASGKSLILYYIVRFMQLENKKTLVIVPTTSLVEQMFKDWKSYGWNNIANYTTKIYSGQFKKYDSPVTIITWQSMIKDVKVLSGFDTLVIDECHLASAKSLTTISKKCVNAKWRLGFSGTYPEKHTTEWFTIVGNLGGIKQYTTYQSLNEAGQVSNLKIENLFLNWPKEVCKMNTVKNYKNYPEENKFIEELPKRNEFIKKLLKNLSGNTIVLFTKIKHGKFLFDSMDCDNCYYVSGETKTDYRELIRSRMENKENVILFASFGVFSTGVNIKNVHNIVMASNYKSQVKVVQSIGRGIRVLSTKKECTIYNIIDDFRYDVNGETYINYSLKHSIERLKIYKGEGYENVNNIRIKFT